MSPNEVAKVMKIWVIRRTGWKPDDPADICFERHELDDEDDEDMEPIESIQEYEVTDQQYFELLTAEELAVERAHKVAAEQGLTLTELVQKMFEEEQRTGVVRTLGLAPTTFTYDKLDLFLDGRRAAAR